MKKNHFYAWPKLCTTFLMGVGALLLASCAVDGFDDETYKSDVYNTHLESPSSDEIDVQASADGKSQTFTWPVVHGAGGYIVSLYYWPTVVDEDENPTMDRAEDTPEEEVVVDSIIDGCSLKLDRLEDMTYRFEIRTLGDDAKGNTSAETTSTITYSTYLATYKTIPDGEDIYQWFSLNPVPDNASKLAYDLEPGGKYTLSGAPNIGTTEIVLRCKDETNRPVITIGKDGKFVIQNGLTLKNLKFDATEMIGNGLIVCSTSPTSSVKKNQEVYIDAAVKDFNIITSPVQMQGCMVKNLTRSLISTNGADWAIVDLIVSDNIIQLNNGEGYTFLDFYKSKNNKCAVKNITFENNTVYNLKDNNTAYFFRLANASNATGAFGTKNGTSTYDYKILHNTLISTFNKKDFGNNVLATSACKNTVNYNIFYDVWRIEKYINNNTVKETINNTLWLVVSTRHNSDFTRTDNEGRLFVTEADPGFKAPTNELDLTRDDGGLNLTPSGIPLEYGSGDPRWLP